MQISHSVIEWEIWIFKKIMLFFVNMTPFKVIDLLLQNDMMDLLFQQYLIRLMNILISQIAIASAVAPSTSWENDETFNICVWTMEKILIVSPLLSSGGSWKT